MFYFAEGLYENYRAFRRKAAHDVIFSNSRRGKCLPCPSLRAPMVLSIQKHVMNEAKCTGGKWAMCIFFKKPKISLWRTDGSIPEFVMAMMFVMYNSNCIRGFVTCHRNIMQISRTALCPLRFHRCAAQLMRPKSVSAKVTVQQRAGNTHPSYRSLTVTSRWQCRVTWRQSLSSASGWCDCGVTAILQDCKLLGWVLGPYSDTGHPVTISTIPWHLSRFLSPFLRFNDICDVLLHVSDISLNVKSTGDKLTYDRWQNHRLWSLLTRLPPITTPDFGLKGGDPPEWH